MITRDEVKQISSRWCAENMGMSADNSWEEISSIVYCTEVFKCDDTVIAVRHIDIEYSFGEYYEVGEDTELFSFICTLCNLPLSSSAGKGMPEEQEIVIYQAE